MDMDLGAVTAAGVEMFIPPGKKNVLNLDDTRRRMERAALTNNGSSGSFSFTFVRARFLLERTAPVGSATKRLPCAAACFAQL
eukprot:586335-Prorocentrum_minimum.AAC.1